jgi:hypothetical protein
LQFVLLPRGTTLTLAHFFFFVWYVDQQLPHSSPDDILPTPGQNCATSDLSAGGTLRRHFFFQCLDFRDIVHMVLQHGSFASADMCMCVHVRARARVCACGCVLARIQIVQNYVQNSKFVLFSIVGIPLTQYEEGADGSRRLVPALSERWNALKYTIQLAGSDGFNWVQHPNPKSSQGEQQTPTHAQVNIQIYPPRLCLLQRCGPPSVAPH